jgi:potassium-dependent mechanosensitive channel
VPNSNLISGVVKNRVRTDRTGRVIVSLTTPRATDPERVRDVMLGAAGAHRDVAREPAPRVLFKRITEGALEFDLVCVVADIDAAARVSSDLHFTIWRDLRSDGIGDTERQVAIKGLDRIEDTLEELVDTIEEVQEAQASAAARRERIAAERAGRAAPAPAASSAVASPAAKPAQPRPAARKMKA